MGKDKLWRFSEIKRFPNVTEAPFSEPFPQKGKWKQEIFKNDKKEEIKIGFRFIFQSKETTLTAAKIDNVYNDIVNKSLCIKEITIPGR